MIGRVKEGARVAVRGLLSPVIDVLDRLGVRPDHVTWFGLLVTCSGGVLMGMERILPTLGTPLFFSARGKRRFQEIAYPRPTVLVFGRESVGLAPDILRRYDSSTVAIPMRDPELRSLNLSTTVALAAYEFRRHWGWRR